MLDIDFCDGKNCTIKNICQRYADFLYKIEHKQDTRYARTGTSKDCPQFSAKRFTGN